MLASVPGLPRSRARFNYAHGNGGGLEPRLAECLSLTGIFNLLVRVRSQLVYIVAHACSRNAGQ